MALSCVWWPAISIIASFCWFEWDVAVLGLIDHSDRLPQWRLSTTVHCFSFSSPVWGATCNRLYATMGLASKENIVGGQNMLFYSNSADTECRSFR